MNDWMIFQAGLLSAAVISAAIGIWILRLTPEKTEMAEPVARLRLAGSVLGLAALIWCVPHARPICFGWMLDWLYPAAVAGAVLGYYFLDYHFSRAMGGILILSSYFFVHGAFDWHTPGLPVVSVIFWIMGIMGICFGGRPCWMRDLLRKCCAVKGWRWMTGGYFLVLCGALLWTFFLTPGGK